VTNLSARCHGPGSPSPPPYPPPVHVRPATDDDAAAIAAVYAPYVTDGVASFEQVAPSPAELATRMHGEPRLPWLVAVRADAVVGYAYASHHRTRAAYRWAVDCSVYVAPGEHRRGVGRALYGDLLPHLGRLGYVRACAGIALPNPASVRLHESVGFRPVGVYERIGWKQGRWHDVGWWQAQLREPEEPPREPDVWPGWERADGG
jgi:L-amino acid N-acyltransferase YncA